MVVATPHGPARVHLDQPAVPPRLMLALGPGGGGVGAPDLLAVRATALASGAVVARIEQPYLVAGRRAPAPARQLDDAWSAVIAVLRERFPDIPLVVGGRSSGARVACRTARATGAVGVLALAFPLHPPWRPQATRAAELLQAGVPVLVVNGDRDPFGVPDPAEGVTVHVIPGADHSLRRGVGQLTIIVSAWLERGFGKQSEGRGVGTSRPVQPEDR